MTIRPAFVLLTCFAVLFADGCASTSLTPPSWRATPAEALRGTLTLDQCLSLAMANDVRAAQWRERLAEAEADIEIANEIPNPSFTATWEDVGLHDAAGAHLATAAYGLAFPFLYWLKGAPPEIAEAGMKSTLAAIASEQRQLRREIGASYFELVAAERREELQRRQIETARQAQRLSSESLRLGIASRHAALQANAESLQTQADRDAALQDARMKGLAMAFALGADRPVVLRVALDDNPASSWTALFADLPTTGSLPDAIVSRALAADPAVAQARAEREAAEASLRSAREDAWPLDAIAGSAERKNEPDGMGNNFSLEIPLPFFSRRGAIHKAEAALAAARAAEEQARRDSLQRLSTDWETHLFARRRAEELAFPLTELRRRLAEESADLFAAGQIEFTELLQSRRDWAQAELDGVDASRELETARWNLACDFFVSPAETPNGGEGARPKED